MYRTRKVWCLLGELWAECCVKDKEGQIESRR